jgi:hypothetical protein
MNEPLPQSEQHLLYLPEHKALICRPCKHAIMPGCTSVLRHLGDTHKLIAFLVRKELGTYADRLEVIEPERIAIPERGTGVVAGLALLNGYECGKCGYICASEGTMVKHCRKEFKWVVADGKRWKECKVQTFLPKIREVTSW